MRKVLGSLFGGLAIWIFVFAIGKLFVGELTPVWAANAFTSAVMCTVIMYVILGDGRG